MLIYLHVTHLVCSEPLRARVPCIYVIVDPQLRAPTMQSPGGRQPGTLPGFYFSLAHITSIITLFTLGNGFLKSYLPVNQNQFSDVGWVSENLLLMSSCCLREH